MYNILICDDERDIVSALKIYLEAEGYTTFAAYNGREALDVLRREKIHLALLDVMMPEMDGIAALSRLREESNVPVILLTAKSEDTDKVLGLNVGADDYVTKPFGMMELLSRIRAVLRRSGRGVRTTVLQAGPVLMDLDRHSVKSAGQDVTLTLKEYDLLRKLMENLNVVFSRDQLLEDVWGYDIGGETRTVDVHVRNLRQKLGMPGEMIETVRGVGYRMRDVLKNE